MNDLIRNAPKTEIKRICKAALQLKKETGLSSERVVPMPSLFGRAGQYRPVDEVLQEETVVLHS